MFLQSFKFLNTVIHKFRNSYNYNYNKGDVGMADFIGTLKDIGYEGALTIEREISGDQQKKDIAEAVKLLETLRADILHA